MKLAVLNPGGRDPDQLFPDGAGTPEDRGHPPVNYHAYAACCSGGFFRSGDSIPEGTEKVLLLLRKRNLRQALESLASLRKRGSRVFISCKESGSHQVADLLGDVTRWQLFQEICSAADGAISSTPELVPLYRSAGCSRADFIPTPYPIDSAAWNFAQPLEKRRGIFVGTREFETPSRNHLAAVVMADEISRVPFRARSPATPSSAGCPASAATAPSNGSPSRNSPEPDATNSPPAQGIFSKMTMPGAPSSTAQKPPLKTSSRSKPSGKCSNPSNWMPHR